MVEFQCAVAARDRDEPMFATASQVRRWLLIEVRGAWGRDAVADTDLARYANGDWRRRLQAEQIRVIAIRRDLDRSSQDALQMFYVDSGGGADRGRCWRRRVATLHAAADAAAGPARTRRPRRLACPPQSARASCARTVATMRAARRSVGRSPASCAVAPHGDDVWECSHIGGDRFAGNLVILPEGLYFGRCDDAVGESRDRRLRATARSTSTTTAVVPCSASTNRRPSSSSAANSA